jgi:pre-mRNA-splicing factor RBM22/SLT11
MQFGLPVGVRDNLLASSGNAIAVPTSDVGMRYYHQQLVQQQREGADAVNTSQAFATDLANLATSRQLTAFSQAMHESNERKSSTAFRNLPKLCSFWLAGSCNRVVRSVCPFRPCCGTYVFPELAATHRDLMNALIARLNKEGPVEVMKSLDADTRSAFRESQKGNRDEAIRKRVFGEDDMSKRYLGKIKAQQVELPAPTDTSITTLWVGNVEADITQEDLRDAFYPYGLLVNIHIIPAAKCAFVEYSTRSEAEAAAKQLYKALVIKGRSLNINWAKPKAQAVTEGRDRAATGDALMPLPPGIDSSNMSAVLLPGMLPPVLPGAAASAEDEPHSTKRQRVDGNSLPQPLHYDSMNPNRVGAQIR